MRYFGYADYYEYWGALEEERGEEVDIELHWEYFKYREFDFCEAEPGKLCEVAGIARRSCPDAIKDLVEHFLIERTDEAWKYKVYLHPPKMYKRAYMNKRLMGQGKTEKDAQAKTTEVYWQILPKMIANSIFYMLLKKAKTTDYLSIIEVFKEVETKDYTRVLEVNL